MPEQSSNPTTNSTLDPHDKRYGALVSVQIDGGMDAVFSMPASITSRDQCESFLSSLMLKVHAGEESFTDEESAFLRTVMDLGQRLLECGLCFKPLRVLEPTEVAEAVALQAKQQKLRVV